LAKVSRYIPSIGAADWDITTMDRAQRAALRDRLVMGTVHTEEEYQTVISYLYRKFPFEMDGVKAPDTGKTDTAIQWRYKPYRNKCKVMGKHGKIFDMYAFVYYDRERDYEPVCVAGSYFKKAVVYLDQLLYEWELATVRDRLEGAGIAGLNPTMAVGEGYVMFCDPAYRRLGLGAYSWQAEAQLYRDISMTDPLMSAAAGALPMHIPCQMEIQNEYSVQSTLQCFPPSERYPGVTDPQQLVFGQHSKHLYVTSNGRVKNDGTHCQIRLLMNYEDADMREAWKAAPANMKEIYNPPQVRFLQREGLDAQDLLQPWKA